MTGKSHGGNIIEARERRDEYTSLQVKATIGAKLPSYLMTSCGVFVRNIVYHNPPHLIPHLLWLCHAVLCFALFSTLLSLSGYSQAVFVVSGEVSLTFHVGYDSFQLARSPELIISCVQAFS